MSLINQVLNKLEQRGAHTAPDQTLIRAVPPRKGMRWITWRWPVAAFLFVLALLGAGLLVGRQQHTVRDLAASDDSAPMRAIEAASTPATTAITVQPAAKLSFELSMPPLPDALRAQGDSPPATIPLVAGITPDKVPEVKVETRPHVAAVVRTESPPPLKQISPQQRADAEYRKGLQARQAGRVPEALAAFETALKSHERHQQARLALAALLLDNGQASAAERVLQAGLALKPLQLPFAMALARMQVEREQLPQAVETLQGYLAQADDNADYQAFYAALLQRQQRHEEALNHYQLALRLQPRNGLWRMGYGISLQALERKEDASLAYRQALATQTLSPELSAFVQQKLKELGSDSVQP